MIIDIHTHIAYHKLYSEGFLNGISETIFPDGNVNPNLIKKIIYGALNDSECQKFIGQMDEAKIDKSVLLIADYGYRLGEAELSISEIHALHYEIVTKYPEKFIVFAGVDPRRGRPGLDLFERSIREYNFRGLKLYPPCGFELDDNHLRPFYDLCFQEKIPVLTHTGPSLKTMRTEKRYPGSIFKIASEYKEVKFILGHGGARDYLTSVQLAKNRENIYFDISAFQNYTEDVNETKQRFRMFFDEVPDQVLFGSDWPMFSLRGSQRKWVDFVIELNVLQDFELEKLFYKNALAVLS